MQDGTDKLTRCPGLRLHKCVLIYRKCVNSTHFGLYPLGLSAGDSHFWSVAPAHDIELTCQYPGPDEVHRQQIARLELKKYA